MIDIRKETVVPCSAANGHLPRRWGDKLTHPSTLYRWAKGGVRGVVLETIRVGGTLCTSLEALQRFCERLSLDGTTASDQPKPVSRRRAEDRAEKEFDRLGF